MSLSEITEAIAKAEDRLKFRQAMDAIGRQPDAADRISRTLFVGMAMVESTAIYCLVIALVLLFANPFLGG